MLENSSTFLLVSEEVNQCNKNKQLFMQEHSQRKRKTSAPSTSLFELKYGVYN